MGLGIPTKNLQPSAAISAHDLLRWSCDADNRWPNEHALISSLIDRSVQHGDVIMVPDVGLLPNVGCEPVPARNRNSKQHPLHPRGFRPRIRHAPTLNDDECLNADLLGPDRLLKLLLTADAHDPDDSIPPTASATRNDELREIR